MQMVSGGNVLSLVFWGIVVLAAGIFMFMMIRRVLRKLSA